MRISDWSSDVCSSDLFRPAGSADLPPRWADFKDPMDALGARFRQRMDEARREAANPRLSREEHDAMQLLGLSADADRAALRRRYSELVRNYHPDRHGGDRSFATRLDRKSVVQGKGVSVRVALRGRRSLK